ncbi:cytochrome b N-terminal domain-containing protein [Desulfopila aestuarii]|uniref:Ubiquinol-cytochrome c reductase cytochrome b subunit n=1 Tax=Desulfopila aestuarii DSM 18488 TaxID=1121416 RepID=A0A1M7YED1_9BACT|nr:cytochrome b N-terminal domain-containing protein [Desulfopila aestuarii]SHO51004.1 ubiquinol-cytochrome c reductase cytochrome b subunit [Desulfopila aestuarii DSM 18488]
MKSVIFTLKDRFHSFRWGGWSLVSLYLSLFSGIVVGLQYDLTDPYYSVAALDLLVPHGEFFRSVHFYSSQAFFLFGCAHLVATYSKTEDYSFQEWVLLICSLVAGLLLLFTGYILRADSTGFAAGMIAESIIKTIPLIGNTLNTLFFAVSDWGMQRVYVHHVITLDLFWLMLAWNHLRRYRVRVADHIPLLCVTLVFCVMVAAPVEPDKLGTTYIAGPWFFLGLQELLRYLHPLFAGVIFPAAFLVALLYAQSGRKHLRLLLSLIYGWLVVYAILTVIASVR